MRPALRYAVSVFVGLIVTGVVAEFAGTDHLLTISLLPLYVAISSIMLAHRQAIVSLSRDAPPARKRGAIVGGVGAFTGGFLLRVSIPAGVAGFGLMFLGMASVIADFDEL
ncbi:hypothetical protein [Haloarcula argentinensis]|uniref:DUF8153 domain-containing protein n=1 Tax=Haloarcula argentinensis TaxID=43776 RepID=A0A847U7X2_HALAR|nr:hypothetical protein [Haloarcula argentinensis]NLV11843.1 hypothetical protein [Haloarcula argentinensis]